MWQCCLICLHSSSCFCKLLQVLLASCVVKSYFCCRVFVAQRESYEDTWINNYGPFVSEYAADASASLLTSQEVCCSIELQLVAEPVQCITVHTKFMQSLLAKTVWHVKHVNFTMKLYAAW